MSKSRLAIAYAGILGYIGIGCLLILPPTSVQAAYDIGSPVVRDLWVDPLHGSDMNDGTTPATALRTLTAAWNSIPMSSVLTVGVRINLQPGTHEEGSIPNYFESRHGTFDAPIWIRGSGTSPDQVILTDDLNIYDSRYLYLENLTIDVTGDVLHCELCDHILIRNVTFNGNGAAREVIKANQSQHLYLENSHLYGAHENVIDYVAVQHGHIINNRIHDGGDWCAYVKGGSAYIRVEANEIHDCGTGGFSAGQGTGFQYMVAPWIQYEAYDIKVTNNVIHDTEGAGLGVNGGYNILLAHNTLYRVGSRSHLIEVVFGLRSCDGLPSDPTRVKCQDYLNQGGWGTTVVDNGSNATNIPDKNVYIFNNLVYNPPGFQSEWTHFAIYDARANPVSSNVPIATTDHNLRIAGNVIWNGDAAMPLGVEDNLDACIATDLSCNPTQLRTDNFINTVRPAFVAAASGNFQIQGDWISDLDEVSIPDFSWDLSAPAGNLDNAVTLDKDGRSRAMTNFPGAYILANPLVHSVDFIAQQYRDFLGRESDTEGLNYWIGQFESGAVTRAQIVDYFFSSAEFQARIAPLARLYFAYFNRIPDYDGLNYWIGQFQASGNLDAISSAFAGSPEFVNQYGPLDNAAFVELVYQNVLGRPAEDSGKTYWLGQLDAGMARGQLMIQFSESPEYRNLSYRWIQVTMMYVGLLRRAPEQAGFDYWVDQLGAGDSVLALIGGFLESDEYAGRFSGNGSD